MVVLLIKYIDPLDEQEIRVTDLSTLRYVLKLASDNYFAVLHMREQMERELNRSAAENEAQKLKLVLPYLPKLYDSNGRPVQYHSVPNPLPKTVPQKIIDALDYIDEQYTIERARAEAEFNDDSEPLWQVYNAMIKLAGDYFKSHYQVENWIGGNSITIAGCTMTVSGDNVDFEWEELNYDE